MFYYVVLTVHNTLACWLLSYKLKRKQILGGEKGIFYSRNKPNMPIIDLHGIDAEIRDVAGYDENDFQQKKPHTSTKQQLPESERIDLTPIQESKTKEKDQPYSNISNTDVTDENNNKASYSSFPSIQAIKNTGNTFIHKMNKRNTHNNTSEDNSNHGSDEESHTGDTAQMQIISTSELYDELKKLRSEVEEQKSKNASYESELKLLRDEVKKFHALEESFKRSVKEMKEESRKLMREPCKDRRQRFLGTATELSSIADSNEDVSGAVYSHGIQKMNSHGGSSNSWSTINVNHDRTEMTSSSESNENEEVINAGSSNGQSFSSRLNLGYLLPSSERIVPMKITQMMSRTRGRISRGVQQRFDIRDSQSVCSESVKTDEGFYVRFKRRLSI